MTRVIVLLTAFLLGGLASVHLYRDTRYLLRASESIPSLLAAEQPVTSSVLIVLQPEDCLRSGELVKRWNALHQAGKFSVAGLVIGDGRLSEQQQAVFDDVHVAMPLRAITARDAEIIAEKLGYTATPFAVVLDREGRVAGSFPAGQNVQAEALERLIARIES